MLKSLTAGILALLASVFGLFHPNPSAKPVATAQPTITQQQPPPQTAPVELTVVNDYFAAPTTLIAGTRFETADGHLFRANERFTVPGKHGKTNGTITIAAAPIAPGEQPTGRLSLPGLATSPAQYAHIYATAAESAAAPTASAALAVSDAAPQQSPAVAPSNSNSTTQQFPDLSSTVTSSQTSSSISARIIPRNNLSYENQSPPLSNPPNQNPNQQYVTKQDLFGLLTQFGRVVSLLPQTATGNFVTHDFLSRQTDATYNSVSNSLRYFLPLGGGTLTGNLKVDGVTGLAAADIPDLSASYLSTAGGTVSGNLTVTGAFSGGALSLANASTTRLSVSGPAYFGSTATSTFGADGSLTLAKALGVGSGGTGSTTLSGILVGSGTSVVNTLTLPSLFSLSGSTLSLGTLGIANGGTGWANINSGSILFGNGTSALATSSNLFWDNTDGRLGIGTTTPQYALTIAGSTYTDTLTAGSTNGVLVVGSIKYPTLASAVSACPATGCSIYVASAQTIPAITITKEIHLSFAPGQYSISGTITFQNVAGVVFEGAGSPISSGVGGTQFNWTGNSSDPMFSLQGVRSSEFSHFTIDSNSAVPLATAIDIPRYSGGGITTSNNFDDIVINGTNGGIQYGFRLGEGSGNNQVDFQKFTHVEVDNYSVAAWSIEYAQAKLEQFIDCSMNSDGYGQYGITTALNGSNGGSFSWTNGGGGDNTVADFYLGSPDDSISIDGGQFEGSARMLVTAGASANSWPITIENVRWAGDQVAQDGKMIIYTQRGPLNLIGNIFGDGTTTVPLQINNQSSGNFYANATGNEIQTTLSNPFTGDGLWTNIGNQINLVSPTLLPYSFAGNVGIGTTSPWAKLSVTGADTSATTHAFVAADSNNKPLFNIMDNGNVGIGGTTTPYALFTVGGSSTQNNWFSVRTIGSSGEAIANIGPATPIPNIGGVEWLNTGWGGLDGQFTTNGGQEFFYNQYYNGGVKRIGADYAGDLSFNSPVAGGWNFAVAPSGSAGSLITYTNAMSITNSGNVGIGTTSPATTLSVAGNTYLTGGLGVGALNTTAGTLNLAGTTGTTTIAAGQGFTVAGSKLAVQQGSGSVLVNTTSNTDNALSYQMVVVPGQGAGNGGLMVSNNQALSAGGAMLAVANYLGKSGSYNSHSLTLNSEVNANSYSDTYDNGVGSLVSFVEPLANNLTLVNQDSQFYNLGNNNTSGEYIANQSDMITQSGTTTKYTGFKSTGFFPAGTPQNTSVATFADFNASPINSISFNGSVGTRYGLLIDFDNTNTTHAYGIYQSSNTLTNYLAGNVGIGTTSPWAKLSVTGADTSATTPAFVAADSNNKPLFNIMDNGNVGIGTTTPTNLLTVFSSAGGNSTGINIVNTAGFANAAAVIDFNASAQANAAHWVIGTGRNDSGTAVDSFLFHNYYSGINALVIQQNGNVGIGTTNPYSHLQVTGPDTASTSAFAVVNSASTTAFAVYDTGNAVLAGGLTQNSDQRLKTDITTLDASSSLAEIEALNPVSYEWQDNIFGGGEQLGFIAQQVQTQFPQLVSTTSPTALTPGGTLGLNYSGLIAPIIGAIQGIVHITGSFQANLIAWLGNASNGIQDLFAKNVYATNITTHQITADELCAKKSDGSPVCVNGDQLAAILAATHQTPAAANTTQTTTSPATQADSNSQPANTSTTPTATSTTAATSSTTTPDATTAATATSTSSTPTATNQPEQTATTTSPTTTSTGGTGQGGTTTTSSTGDTSTTDPTTTAPSTTDTSTAASTTP